MASLNFLWLFLTGGRTIIVGSSFPGFMTLVLAVELGTWTNSKEVLPKNPKLVGKAALGRSTVPTNNAEFRQEVIIKVIKRDRC